MNFLLCTIHLILLPLIIFEVWCVPLNGINSGTTIETATKSKDTWKSVLKKMTEENPCGSNENYTICQQCGELTNNENAFYMCCLNIEDIRQFCIRFVNYTID